ncbi:3-deoxy-7-phosphoheptulonate synthase [Patescibacteria group bacterium]
MINKKNILKHKPLIVAGPCSVSSKEQIFDIASKVKDAGAHLLRAQLWKPRTKPNSFQGVGRKGIPWIKELKEKVEIPIAMEVVAKEQVNLIREIADLYWIGARNMQNYELLKEVGKNGKPVILKRGLISTVGEWIGAADYIGREKVILCERGIRTGADSMKFTLDLNSALVAKHDFKMPVIVDPSHSAGRRDMVPQLAYSAIAAGLDGIVIETHVRPDLELVDKEQTISVDVFKKTVKKVKELYEVVNH